MPQKTKSKAKHISKYREECQDEDNEFSEMSLIIIQFRQICFSPLYDGKIHRR